MATTVTRSLSIIVEDIEDGEYEDVKRNALSISSQVHRLESLITDILDLAKADLVNTETELINLNDLLTETSSKLTKAYEATDIVIDLKVPPTLMIRTEKTRLTQILENLLSNAIKYRDQNKNSPFVQVSILETPDNVMITVEDNGVGIPDEYKSKVFEIFQRFHPSIAIGSGLGLYIVKKHIDKMDAEIFFSSSNNGSSFNIIIKKENGK